MRLIDADLLKEKANDTDYMPTDKWVRLSDIEDMPTIDAVKHGKWINDKGLYKCTACNNLLTVAGWDIPEEQIYKSFKFCPNCGAKMERREE